MNSCCKSTSIRVLNGINGSRSHQSAHHLCFSRFSPLKSGLSPALSVYKNNHMQTEELYCFKLPYWDGIGSSHKHDPWLSVFLAHPAFLSFPFLLSSLLSRLKKIKTKQKKYPSLACQRSDVIRGSLEIAGSNQISHLKSSWFGAFS